jgi:hypothetical protein
MYTDTVKELPGYPVHNCPSGSFLFLRGDCRQGGNSIRYCVNGLPQKETLDKLRTPVCFRILSSSLSSVSMFSVCCYRYSIVSISVGLPYTRGKRGSFDQSRERRHRTAKHIYYLLTCYDICSNKFTYCLMLKSPLRSIPAKFNLDKRLRESCFSSGNKEYAICIMDIFGFVSLPLQDHKRN